MTEGLNDITASTFDSYTPKNHPDSARSRRVGTLWGIDAPAGTILGPTSFNSADFLVVLGPARKVDVCVCGNSGWDQYSKIEPQACPECAGQSVYNAENAKTGVDVGYARPQEINAVISGSAGAPRSVAEHNAQLTRRHILAKMQAAQTRQL